MEIGKTGANVLNRDAKRVPRVITGLGSQCVRKATPGRQAKREREAHKERQCKSRRGIGNRPNYYSRQTSSM